MNHIPKFLIPQKKKRMSSSSSNRAPKLERRFALRKDIDYEPPPSSDSSACQSLRTHSLDIPNNTSFRIHGVEDGEVDLVFRSLGLSPDDFAIPIASWEAHKARSVSDLRPPRGRQDASERDGDARLEKERETLGERRLNEETATNSNTGSVVDVGSGDICRERERETLGERRLNEETATNCKTRTVFDVASDDMCREREREAVSESNDSVVTYATRSNQEMNDETATNKETRTMLDFSSDDMCRERAREALGEKWGEDRLSKNNSVINCATGSVLDVSNGDTCGERERETLGEKRGFELSDKFQDSVRVSDEMTTTSDRFIVMDSFDIDNTRPILNISTEDMYNDRYANGDRGGIKGVRINLVAPTVSPMGVNDRSSMFDFSNNDINTNRYTIVESTDNSSTSRTEIKRLSIDNTSSNWELTGDFNNVGANVTEFANIESTGGIKGVRPPLLAPPPSISARVIDNTSSTWDIMRSFAPDSDENPSPVRERSSYYDDEEEREARPRGNAAFLSESCSFTTTSNDDDSSSTTTEPMSNISPNGRFKRVITYWEKGELLGRGSFGTVYEGIADGGYFIAVKEVSLLDQGDMGRQSIYQLEQEIALLSQFEHENIVQYYGTDKDDAHLYIFLELVTKGSLLSLYQKYHLRDSQVSSYTRQILNGLKYLHERNVVHRDIKCANILVGADGSVKLADFGLAKATKLNDVKSCKGTAFWMAPEVVRGRNQGYGLPADIWSLGCTVLEMLTHRIPYSPLEWMPALFRIGRGEPPPIPESLSRDARDFISRCLNVDPNDRPTATQLLEHAFVKRPLSTSSGSSSPYHSVGRGINVSSR